MSLDGHVFTAADGVKGFDANRVITPDVADKFFAHGYRFCVRYVPGLYVGFRCGLTPAELYRALRFTHYWGAYNLNSDEAPAVRGLQMKQSSPKALDAVAGCAFEFQVDTVRGDALGGHPTLIA